LVDLFEQMLMFVTEIIVIYSNN